MKVNTSIKGTCSELKACIWLMEQGYFVFRNVAPTGDVDIVAIRDGEILKIDVKSVYTRTDGYFQIAKNEYLRKEARDIRILLVYPDDTIGWFNKKDWAQYKSKPNDIQRFSASELSNG